MKREKDPLIAARKLLQARRFHSAILLLQDRELEYHTDFEFYYYLGLACLYVNDIGGASFYFNKARKISVLDTRLLIAQAAIFLKRGATDEAVEYYLNILDDDPNNKIASEGLKFIKQLSQKPDMLSEWIATNKIKRFYPPLGIHPLIGKLFGLVCIICVAAGGVLFALQYYEARKPPQRADLSAFVLSVDQRNNALQQDLSGSQYRYILNAREVNETYEKAQEYFQKEEDNLAQREINKLLNSNASVAIQQNARLLMQYFVEPSFDTFKTGFTYSQVAEDIYLYLDCWVMWSGRIANSEVTDTSYSCDLLVGYENQERVEGIVPLVFDSAMNLDPSLPITVLGKISLTENGKLYLKGKSVYQSVDGSTL